jgi:hypothetical protein
LEEELEETMRAIKARKSQDDSSPGGSVSRFDEVTPADVAYLENENVPNPYCHDLERKPVSGEDLYQAIKPMVIFVRSNI